MRLLCIQNVPNRTFTIGGIYSVREIIKYDIGDVCWVLDNKKVPICFDLKEQPNDIWYLWDYFEDVEVIRNDKIEKILI
jgi:hypothetical protein